MMAAAQAAAEAALRDAAGERNSDSQQSEEPSEATLAALLQQGGYDQFGVAEQAIPQQLLADAVANPDDENKMQSLLQLMAQQEQERQHLAALAAIASRPQEHYFSIAQNGEFQQSTP